MEIKIKHRGIYHSLELGGEELFRFTYQRNSFEDIEQFKASFSQSIDLPGNNNNIKVLENVTSLDRYILINNIENEVFINKSFDCVYIIDGYNFEGILTIDSISKIHATKDFIISCSIRGSVISIKELLGDKLLRSDRNDIEGLDLSELNHELSLINVLNTWNNYENQPYYYGIDDRTKLLTNKIRLNDLRPSIKAKYLIDKIFDSIGYTYESEFIESEEFNDILHPWVTSNIILDENISDRNKRADLISTVGPTRYAKKNVYTNSLELTFSGDTDYNVISEYGVYNFKVSGAFNTKIFLKKPVEKEVTLKSENNNTLQLLFYRERNGVKTLIETLNYNYSFGSIDYLNTGIKDLGNKNFSLITSNIELIPGDIITVKYRVKHDMEAVRKFNILDPFSYDRSKLEITNLVRVLDVDPDGFKTNFQLNTLQPTQYYIGQTIKPSLGIPNNIKQWDYLKSIFKRFNLVINFDRNNTNKLIIEPIKYDGEIIDWTRKLDTNEKIEVLRLEEYLNKNILFKSETDNNYYNLDYLENFELNYGSFRVLNLEESTENDYVISDIFSGTLNYYIPNTFIPIPQMYILGDDGSVKETTNFKMRILYRNVIDLNSNTWFNYVGINDSPLVDLDITDEKGSTLFIISNFPNITGNITSINTISNFSSIDMEVANDLNFGFQYNYYYDIKGLPTDNNVYNRFWIDTVNILLNPNTSLIRAFLYLNTNDIFELDFNRRIKIKENLYIVNRILNWYNGETCEVELIKLI